MAIDAHAHFVPQAILEDIWKRGKDYGVELLEATPGCHCVRFSHGQQIRPFFETLMNVDMRLETMEAQGVDRQVLSLWCDIFGYGLPADKGAQWHQVLNNSLAGIIEQQPEKFSWLCSGPLQNPDGAIKELIRCKDMGALGTIVGPNVEGVNLGECDGLEEFWAACVELGMPIFIHPAIPVPTGRAKRFGLAQVVAYTEDTTYAVGSLILSGVLDRHPELKLFLAHGGGPVPWLAGRFDIMHNKSNRAMTGDVAENAPSSYLKKFFYDTVLHDTGCLNHLKQIVGTDQMVLGTDVPFPIAESDPLGLLQRAGFSAQEIHEISEDNVRRLFARLP